MSLKLRLNLIITGLLLLVMLAGITLSFNNARKNTLAEIASAEKSTLFLFDSAIVGTLPKNASSIDLSIFKLQQLSHMRHLKIELIDSQGKLLDSNQVASHHEQDSAAPAWFERLLNAAMPKWQPKIRTLLVNNQLLAKLIITPDPSYEYAEVWKQMTDLLVLLALFFISVNLMIAWAIAQALKPTESILHTLNALEKGDLAARLPHFKLPEMARIGEKFNHMIEALHKSTQQNHSLTQQLISLQEEERKSLARDLHDEFGQCLTAINTDANVILKQAKKKYPELQASAQAISELSRHLIQLVNGLLQRLRPGVLDELGLELALQDLVAVWQTRNERIDCKLNMDNTEDLKTVVLGETECLVIYRLVQEALTNITRHASASQVDISLYAELKSNHANKNMRGITVKIQDNGTGFNDHSNAGKGFGLLGMRERIENLNGSFTLQDQTINNKLGQKQSATGVLISAWVPLGSLK